MSARGCPGAEHLERFVASAPDVEDGARIARHLETCTTCAAWVAEARRDDELLGEAARILRRPRDPSLPDVALPVVPGYRLRRLLGRGGMGWVFEAEQQRPERIVALKVLAREGLGEDRLARFRLEIAILARLEHPGLARVYDAGTFDRDGVDTPYFAMERIDGVTLDRWVAQQAPPRPRRLRVFVEIAEAIHFAHRRGVVHRDLKPGNVLVDPREHAKVVDFGVARLLDDAETDGVRTRTGELVGTLAYMAPEQVTTPAAVDARTDVYALGVVLYELLTGATPIECSATSVPEVARRIAKGEIVPPRTRDRTLRGDLEAILLCALARDPRDRYASAEELAQDVRAHLEGRPVRARRRSSWSAVRYLARRHRTFLVATALVVLALALGLAGTAWQAIAAGRAEARAREEGAQAERARDDALRETRRVLAMQGFLKDVLGSFDLGRGGRPHDVTVLELLEDAEERLRRDGDLDPISRAELAIVLAQSFQALGRLADAEPLTLYALDLRRRELGEDHELFGAALNSLGVLRTAQRRPDEARELYERALAIYDRTLPADHRYRAATWNNLATLDIDAGRLESAEERLRRALVLFEAHGLAGEVANVFAHLAGIHRARGEREACEALERRAVEVYREFRPAGDTRLAGYLSRHAISLAALGRIDEARERMLAAVAAFRAVRGDGAPEVFQGLEYVARLGRTHERWAECADAWQLARTAERALRGSSAGRRLAATRFELAETGYALGRIAAVEEQLAALHDELLAEPSDDAALRVSVLGRLVDVWTLLGRTGPALDAWQREFSCRPSSLSHGRLLRALRADGQLENAERWAREAFVAGSPWHAPSMRARLELADILSMRGDPAEAAVHLDACVGVEAIARGSDPPGLGVLVSRMARLAELGGDLDRAHARYARALDVEDGRLPADHYRLGELEAALARLERDRPALGSWEARAERALTILRAALGEDAPATRDAEAWRSGR